ncbi:MAG: hypothetical protein KDJ31_15995 [Candidatus Competibacteraceae bacterium]|nr:hypothetical protein [Candidatus Competibacteraceae bacterium]
MSGSKQRYHPRRVAYELWCLQEERRDARVPVGGLGSLILELRRRHPRLEQSVVDQAVDIFLNQQIEESRAQIIRHREWILSGNLSLPSARSSADGSPNPKARLTNVTHLEHFHELKNYPS